MTHKSLRKFERKLLVRALQREEFPWDYSYFKWQDMPVEVRRESIRESSLCGRTWITDAPVSRWMSAERGSRATTGTKTVAEICGRSATGNESYSRTSTSQLNRVTRRLLSGNASGVSARKPSAPNFTASSRLAIKLGCG